MSSESTSNVEINVDVGSGRPSLILNLPDELLCIVLAVVAEMDPPQGTHIVIIKRTRDEVLGFLRLSEVCTRFRALLLSMAAIWAGVVFQLPIEAGKLALARSKSALLPVRIPGPYKSHLHTRQERENPSLVREYLIALAIEHVARMCSLRAQDLSPSNYNQILSGPLLHLENIEMIYNERMNPSQDLGHICVDGPIVRRARFLFRKLRFFHLFGTGLTFKFPALQSLVIKVDDSFTKDVLRPHWVVGMLRTSPLLDKLELNINTSSIPIDWSALFNGRNAQLAHLRSLELHGSSAANLPEFFKHLGSPRPARCIANFEYTIDANPAHVEDMLIFLNTFASLLQYPSHNSLLVDIDSEDIDDPKLVLQMFPKHQDRRLYSIEDIDDMANIVQLSMPSDDLLNSHRRNSPVMDIIVKTLQGNKIRQLIVHASALNELPTVIESIALACTAVTELVVLHAKVWDNAHSDFPIPTTPGIFPALDSVFFQPSVVTTSGDAKQARSCWEEYTAWLASRARAGLRVRRLHIIGHGEWDKELYARAAEFVDEFIDARINVERTDPFTVLNEDNLRSSNDSDSDMYD